MTDKTGAIILKICHHIKYRERIDTFHTKTDIHVLIRENRQPVHGIHHVRTREPESHQGRQEDDGGIHLDRTDDLAPFTGLLRFLGVAFSVFPGSAIKSLSENQTTASPESTPPSHGKVP